MVVSWRQGNACIRPSTWAGYVSNALSVAHRTTWRTWLWCNRRTVMTLWLACKTTYSCCNWLRRGKDRRGCSPLISSTFEGIKKTASPRQAVVAKIFAIASLSHEGRGAHSPSTFTSTLLSLREFHFHLPPTCHPAAPRRGPLRASGSIHCIASREGSLH